MSADLPSSEALAPSSETADAVAPLPEVDVWWGGYDIRAVVPNLLTAIGFTAVIIGVAYYLWDEHRLRANLARWLAYDLNGLLWLYHLLRWSYRLVSCNYRLTTQRLYVWRGIRSLPPPPMHLPDVQAIQVEQNWLERRLDVGRLTVHARGHVEPLVLTGVRRPQVVAALILKSHGHAQPHD